MTMDEILRSLFPVEEAARDNGACPFCGTPVNMGAFRDELSRREYQISGLCQTCQDETFNEGE